MLSGLLLLTFVLFSVQFAPGVARIITGKADCHCQYRSLMVRLKQRDIYSLNVRLLCFRRNAEKSKTGKSIFVVSISEVAREKSKKRAGGTPYGKPFGPSAINLINYCKNKCFPRWREALFSIDTWAVETSFLT